MIPERVKVAGIDYEIREEKLEEDYNYLGQILYNRGIIKISKELSQDRKEQVFVHELTHAIYNEAGFEEQDEDVINRVSMILYQVLKNNKFEF